MSLLLLLHRNNRDEKKCGIRCSIDSFFLLFPPINRKRVESVLFSSARGLKNSDPVILALSNSPLTPFFCLSPLARHSISTRVAEMGYRDDFLFNG